MSKSTERKSDNKKGSFVRKTVSIPAELAPFAEQRTSRPEHAGNFSSYLRWLILQDQAGRLKDQAA